MSAIQIILFLFAAFAVTRAFRQFRTGALTIAWLTGWCVFWVLVVVVALRPEATNMLAHIVGVGRGADFIIYLSLVALFYLAFRMFVKIEDVEREVTQLVRKIALDEQQGEEDPHL